MSIKLHQVSIKLRLVFIKLHQVSVKLRQMFIKLRQVSIKLRQVFIKLRQVLIKYWFVIFIKYHSPDMVLNLVRTVDIKKIFTFSLSQQHRIHKTQIANLPHYPILFFPVRRVVLRR